MKMLQREIRGLSLKTKSFVDARQEFESLDYNIRQLHRGSSESRPFEDSICSNVDGSIVSSTRITTPDETLHEIHKLVKKFLSHSVKTADGVSFDADNISLSIAKYLTTTAVNFRSPSEETEELLSEVIQTFKSFLPSSVEILKPESIATFVAQIIGSFNDTADENHIEILREIISNTIESANQTAISSNSYLQHLLTEIFKMMIITLRIPDDISENECTHEIVERLARLNGVSASVRHVVIGEVVEDILDFAVENLEEGMDADLLKKVITNIIGKL